jgi:glycosyltransferase XagB
MRTGEWLLDQRAITPADLANALALQAHWRANIGDILLAMRRITPPTWLRALAAQNLPTRSLADTPINAALLKPEDLQHYIAKRYLPHHAEGDTLHLVTPAPDESLQRWAETHYGCRITLTIITAREHHKALQNHFAAHLSRLARLSLQKAHPTLSALQSVWQPQRQILFAFILALVACVVISPLTTWYTLLVLSTVFYLTTLGFKFLLLQFVPKHNAPQSPLIASARALPEASLPIYSILVPLHREPPQVVAQLLAGIDALNYPKTKLEVWLLVEADDAATKQAIIAQSPADYCRILEVPPSKPRTKPKACNVALPLISGEFVTIYDAEDIPDPQQLRLSVAAFRAGSDKLACLQTPLNYYNYDENLLSRWFAVEYSALFRLFLPALKALRIPIPLGGTSNHLRVSMLRKLHGWDPYNVTEDADLGVRLAYFGYETDLLPSRTEEESPLSLRAWLAQRSRWIKGYVQTWLVYMREPRALMQNIGIQGFFGFQLFVGAPALTFLIAPFFWVISLLLIFGLLPSSLLLPGWLKICCMLTFGLGFLLHWITAVMALRREDFGHMPVALALYPFYWFLHSVACIRAFWELAFRPHYWAKTTHGVSRRFLGFSDKTVDSPAPAL